VAAQLRTRGDLPVIGAPSGRRAVEGPALGPATLAADPALPLRDVLLDESAMCDVLRALGSSGDARIADCALLRVNYQVGKSLRAVFRIAVDEQTHIVAARMFREGKSADAYARSAPCAHSCGDLHGIVHLQTLDCVAWLFPHDRKIHTLPAVLSGEPPAETGRRPTPESFRLAAYAPEKSATLAYLNDADRPVAYVKVAAAHQAERDHRTYQDLRAGLDGRHGRLQLPRPIAYRAAERALWLEAVDGRRLAETSGSEQSGDLRRLGAAVAAFHALSAPDAPPFDRFSAARLANDATVIARIRPDVAGGAVSLSSRLRATAPAASAALVCLHGDLHPKNAIDGGDRIALIDVEDVARGPAAADIGSLIASLMYLEVCGQLPRTRFAEQATAFLDGYASAGMLPETGSMVWHTAAALFIERASRAVTRIRPLGLNSLDALITQAERVLDRGLDLP
jgi:aminoglycoside phosphotransferase (APT) family kinase protein